MARKVRREFLLGAILLVLLLVAGYRAWDSTAQAPSSSYLEGARAPALAPAPSSAAEVGDQGLATVPDVRLEALGTGQVDPNEDGRNPFRFEAKPPPAPPATRSEPGPVPPPRPQGPLAPPGPPPAPPIALKFIGIVDAPEGGGKVAVLSDGRFVYHGKEGGLIDGRYRIVHIGVESIVIEHVDGRGRQTIRLSGS